LKFEPVCLDIFSVVVRQLQPIVFSRPALLRQHGIIFVMTIVNPGLSEYRQVRFNSFHSVVLGSRLAASCRTTNCKRTWAIGGPRPSISERGREETHKPQPSRSQTS